MLHKTRGIAFRTTSYAESSVIVQVFTEKFGMQSYIINGVKKPKAKISMNMLQPLHLLEMVVYHKPSGNIQRIAELRNQPLYQTLPYDVAKSSLAIFLNEVLYKSIRQQTGEHTLFEFVYSNMQLLDQMESGTANYHLWFMLQLSRYLGFYPDTSGSNYANYFDLQDGVFTKQPPLHRFVIQGTALTAFRQLLGIKAEELAQLHIAPSVRKDLLESLLDYYRIHLDGFGEIKSHAVLQEVLH